MVFEDTSSSSICSGIMLGVIRGVVQLWFTYDIAEWHYADLCVESLWWWNLQGPTPIEAIIVIVIGDRKFTYYFLYQSDIEY